MASCSVQILLPVLAHLSIHANGENVFLGRQKNIDLEATLQELLNNRNGTNSWAKRWHRTEAHMSRSSVALPRSEKGKLSPQAVRYLVHGYFVQEHGWLIRGLGPHVPRENAAELHQASILKDKAPRLLEILQQARESETGLFLSDAVAMAVTLERLIIEECLELLEAAYKLNGFAAETQLKPAQLREVLLSFLLLFEVGAESDASNPDVHSSMKQHLYGSGWDEFQQVTVNNFVFSHRSLRNPFLPLTFSFEVVPLLVESLAHDYGKWQNSECQMMKAEIMKLDFEGFGRVPLSRFYAQKEHAVYKFDESTEYLKTVGALDERYPQDPQVIIANYLAGPSNCVAGSSYYSICCLSECEGLMAEVEEQIQAPSASVEQLVTLVGELSSSTVEGPRQLPKALIRKLNDVATLHGGQIPLHGRLFAQWFHYAFPLECQYPQQVLTKDYWEEREHSATAEQKEHFIKLGSSAADNIDYMPVGDGSNETDQELPQWSEEEVLPFAQEASVRSVATGWIVAVARGLAGLILLYATLKALISATRAESTTKTFFV